MGGEGVEITVLRVLRWFCSGGNLAIVVSTVDGLLGEGDRGMDGAFEVGAIDKEATATTGNLMEAAQGEDSPS